MTALALEDERRCSLSEPSSTAADQPDQPSVADAGS